MQNDNYALEIDGQRAVAGRPNDPQDDAEIDYANLVPQDNAEIDYANLVPPPDFTFPPTYRPRFNYSATTLHRLDLFSGGMTAISALAFVNGVAGLVDGRDRTASIGLAVTGFVGCLTGLGYNATRENDIVRTEELRESNSNIWIRRRS